MFQALKKVLYFPLASYFRFFAAIRLARWNPRVIVITGSSGKTTLLHLAESQFGQQARYSHHANSSYGIPFDILGLSRKTLFFGEWFGLFLKAPLMTFSKIPKQNIYVVEADCDRPGEGKFVSTLLNPLVTIWASSSRTHSMNFDRLVKQDKFETVDEAIADEYGTFIESSSRLAIINCDIELINKQLTRTHANVIKISKNEYLENYEISRSGTSFKIKGETYNFPFLLPEAVFFSISAITELAKYLGKPIDKTFKNFTIPPARSSMFAGIRDITIIDSSYNSNLESATEVINMFNKIRVNKKWAVIGDMLEQGKSEKEEHERLAQLIIDSNYDRVVLLGPRILKHGYPILKKRYKKNVVAFVLPKEVLGYLLSNIKGGETILFKGARFLEGVIENLLLDKSDAQKLARREKIWEIRRKKWGL